MTVFQWIVITLLLIIAVHIGAVSEAIFPIMFFGGLGLLALAFVIIRWGHLWREILKCAAVFGTLALLVAAAAFSS